MLDSLAMIKMIKMKFSLLQEGDTHYNSMDSDGDNDDDENPP